MIILVDQDGVCANLDKGVEDLIRRKCPNTPIINYENRKLERIEDEYAQHRSLIRKDICYPGFIKNLSPIEGCVEAVNEIAREHDVFFCTRPLTDYDNCVLEKYQWIEKHFGRKWTKKMILTKDKTLIKGDILIDDVTEVRGVAKPEWEHIIYDHPWNRHVTNKRRLTWRNWKEVLEKII